jgi:hypothetical protein
MVLRKAIRKATRRFRSKAANVKEAGRERKRDKIMAYRKLGEKMGSDTYNADDTSKKGKRKRQIKRESINKQRRKDGTIAKNMPDIAGAIKKSGDQVLKSKLSKARTRTRTFKGAQALGIFPKNKKKKGKK